MSTRTLHTFVSNLSKPTLLPMLKEIGLLLGVQHEQQQLEQTEEEELREKLKALLTNKGYLKQAYQQLTQYEQEVVAYFIFQVGSDILTYRQIEQGVQGIKPNLFRLGLTGLRRKGLIYTLRRQWGEVAYIQPEDIQTLLYDVWLDHKGKEEEVIYQSPATIVEQEGRPFFVDLFFLLDNIRSQPEAQIPLTQKGTVHKRFIRFWEELITDRQEALVKCSISFADRHVYSSSLAILLDFLTREKIIEWYEGYIQLNQEHAEKWFSLSRDEMRDSWLLYWMKHFPATHPWLERYQQDMLRNEDEQWIHLLSYVERWEDQYDLPGIPELQKQIKMEVIHPLESFGLIERGQSEVQEEMWRWLSYEEADAEALLQPTMEIYCSQLLPFASLWKLADVFTLNHWEQMLVLQLSREKVLAMIERGMDLQKWLDWLHTFSAIPVPQNFVQQLEQWQKERQQIWMADKTLIHIKEEQLANAFCKWSKENHLHVQHIDRHYFFVDREIKNDIVHLLTKKGIHVKLDDTAEHREIQQKTRAYLISTPRDLELRYKVESVFPHLAEAIPVWNTIPEMWKKQFSSYHEQTKRDMIEQAINYDLHLRIEDGSGDIMELQPTSCRVEHGTWICYDKNHLKYELGQINKMQLLLPR